ncbi:zinc finger, C2H2 type [Oesophagostomum dentatum]|uniref:Zinc finger, C2H2 type n=1 Tax=Oesophagostomum dentatum TaxID=61180 RepID=A0A0B1TM07_OESDE|nr:zinc finger, C2H2 type [Oesophagostomum dentatum]
MDLSRDEAKRQRDEDFAELMAACDTAKSAVKNENGLSKTLERLKIEDDPLPEADIEEPSAISKHTYNDVSVPAVDRPERIPRALDKLDSSVESEDPLTVVEKDDNGFVFYKCRFCGLTFNYMNTLRAHERVHNISQPYVCGKCGESYEFACQLEYHTLQHGGEYKCSFSFRSLQGGDR